MGRETKARPLRHAGCAGFEVNARSSQREEALINKAQVRSQKSEVSQSLVTSAATTALVALGSNLGDSVTLIHRAFERLQDLSSTPVRKSSLWQTTPLDCPPGSPLFVNAGVALTPLPGETPESLLAKLQTLEKQFGRRPKIILNEPRPLDLDLIAFGNEVRNRPELILPHPRAHLRRFVLQPLSEVAPDFVLPWQMKTISQLLESLGAQISI